LTEVGSKNGQNAAFNIFGDFFEVFILPSFVPLLFSHFKALTSNKGTPSAKGKYVKKGSST